MKNPYGPKLKSFKTEKPEVPGTQIFKARTRVLLDLLLFGNIGVLTASIVSFSWGAYLATAVCFSGALVLFWLLVVAPLSKVELTPQTLTGRGPDFKKRTIQIRKVDIRVTNSSSSSWQRRYLWKDIWTVDEQCVRLYRRVLGERNVAKIMTVIERYPFRESAVPPPASETQS